MSTLDETVTSVRIQADAVVAGDDFYNNLTAIRLTDGAVVRTSDGKVMYYLDEENLRSFRKASAGPIR